MQRLAGKVAVITGGATGLGREIARLYAEAGARVAVGDIRPDDSEEAVALIEAAGGEAFFQLTDVTKLADVQALVDEAERRWGAVHLATANAGILGRGHGKTLDELADDEIAQIIDVNFGGTYRTFKAAAPAIQRAGGGAMTATTSLSGHRGYPGLSAYSSSKGAVLALVRSLAVELYPAIRVNAVSPGAMATEMRAHSIELGAEVGEQSSTVSSPPFGGVAEPRQVAFVHLFLVSDDASFVNGQSIIADGGRSILPGTTPPNVG